MKLHDFQLQTFGKWITLIPTIEVHIDNPMYREKNIALILNIFIWHFRWLFIEQVERDANSDILEWLGKNCKDCGNEKCKKLGALSKGYDCALWQQKVENYSIKTVTNAKDAENYPISEDISKGIEEINKLIFGNVQAESEDKE